jgi:hypothetical protein
LNFLKQLLGRGCTHRFSWPRSGEDGRYYQICLACGTAYEYDWIMMRRTDRLLAATIQHGLQVGAGSHFRGLPLK